jgi:hypothetical protein
MKWKASIGHIIAGVETESVWSTWVTEGREGLCGVQISIIIGEEERSSHSA